MVSLEFYVGSANHCLQNPKTSSGSFFCHCITPEFLLFPEFRLVTAPVETSQEKATSSKRHRWQEERQKFHRRTQKVVSARWGHCLQPGDYSVSLPHNIWLLFMLLVFL